MRKTTIAIIAILLVALSTASILFLFPYEPDQPPAADDSSATDIQKVVDANNEFALELYGQLDQSSNLFISPYSISSALAMAYEGAASQTAEEMKEVFHFPDHLKENFAAIYNSINAPNRDYELRTGNALWLQEDYPFLDSYTSMIERYYGGKAANLDFVHQPEESRQTINNFIEEQTNQKIKDLIPPGVLNDMTRMVITNAIYFKGTWVWQFDKSDTMDMDFYTPDSTLQVPMMHMDPEKARLNYAELEDIQILELPYQGGKISMLIILPAHLDSLELTSENLASWKDSMQETKLDAVYLPKFEFSTKYFLRETLSAMGMSSAFEPEKADLSGMTGKKELYISSVIHQAFVEVDEEGTEAAAATAVVVGITSIQPQTIFRADRPFIFIIQENETGNILFLGRVINPKDL